jgi:hypothetical protein
VVNVSVPSTPRGQSLLCTLRKMPCGKFWLFFKSEGRILYRIVSSIWYTLWFFYPLYNIRVISGITDKNPLYRMNIRYNKFIKISYLYNPTQNLIIFRALYSESKTDKYKPSKLQSTLSSLTTTFSYFASRHVQHLAVGFLKRVLTIMWKWGYDAIENFKLYLVHSDQFIFIRYISGSNPL